MKLFDFDPEIKIIENDEINLMSIFKVIWSGRLFIILTTVIGSLLVLAYTYTLTPLYKSEISLYPVTSSPTSAGMSQLQSMASSFGYDVGGSEANFNIPDVVKSQRIKLSILNKKWHFDELNENMTFPEYWHKDDKPGIISRIFGEKEENPELIRLKQETDGLKKINERITVTESKKTGLITVSVLSEEPKLSKDIVTYIAEALISYINDVQGKRAGENRQFIEERIAEASAQLEKSEESLKSFREENRSIKDSPELQMQLERLMRDAEVNKQVFITLKQQYEIARIEEVKEAPVVNVLDEGREAVEKDWPKRFFICCSISILLCIIFVIFLLFIRIQRKMQQVDMVKNINL